MTAVLLLAAEVPLMQHLFPPVPLIEQVQNIPTVILVVLDCCLTAAFLALWRAAPDYRVFRTLGVYIFLTGVVQFLAYLGGNVPSLSVRAITTALIVELAGEAMGVPKHRWTRFFWPVYLFAAIAVWFPSMVSVSDWPIYVAAVPLGILIVQGFRHGNARDRMVAVAFSIYFFVRLTLSNGFEKLTSIGNYVTIGGWRWSMSNIMQFLLATATLVIFVRDLIRDRREKERMAAELAAGRAVQQVLIPEDIPTILGFKIQSVYKPFGEVGGDFFQVLPSNALPINNDLVSGGVLVIIGDVSGKGMPAAMTVSLLVGTVRTLAHYTQSPGEILAAMNQRMLARSHGGFTTCLVLRADPDGTLTIANAGHIPPYVDGRELQLENGLPLGISADTIYADTTLQLSPRQQLTLLTDGVVEARDKTGALYGFERTAARSTEPAESIALAAQKFGQDDDITVLTLARTA
jgi:Stage II sporulation protein E (SpoIIE)